MIFKEKAKCFEEENGRAIELSDLNIIDKRHRSVCCIETSEIFSSCLDAVKLVNVGRSNMVKAYIGIQKTVGEIPLEIRLEHSKKGVKYD